MTIVIYRGRSNKVYAIPTPRPGKEYACPVYQALEALR